MAEIPELEKKKKRLNDYARYSGMAFQMIAIMLAFLFSGIWLDKHFALHYPVFTATFALFGAFLAIYYFIRDLL
ncbi:MAG: AtpZ/AtpI family protein [Bacteroidia bacterium]